MSAHVVQDRDGMWQVVVDGNPVTGEGGRPLRFEDYQRAREVADARRDER